MDLKAKHIVERLRCCKGRAGQSLTLEAADEIERLRMLCEHWEIKYARLKIDYVDLVEKGKLRGMITNADVAEVLRDDPNRITRGA